MQPPWTLVRADLKRLVQLNIVKDLIGDAARHFGYEDRQGNAMKTSVIEVRDMLSVLSVAGVEERIGNVPGVESVTVNYAAGSATVRYDETRLAAGDIKAAVHQSGNESAGESQPKHVSEHKPAVNGHEDHVAPDAKPSTPVAAVPKAAPVAPAAVPAPAAKSSTPANAEPKADVWKVHALSLATTLGVTYISCAVFDLVFPPFGLLAALAPASPWPISGSPLAFLTGFALFTVAGLVLGALYGIASKFWSKRLQ